MRDHGMDVPTPDPASWNGSSTSLRPLVPHPPEIGIPATATLLPIPAVNQPKRGGA